MAITRYAGDRFTIGAGETKPTGVLDGAVLIDTGNLELYVKRDGVWVEITGAGTDALPGAPLNSVQFNNAGSFGGDADLTFTDGNRLNVNKLGISGNIYDSNNSIGNNGMVLTNEGATGVNWKAIEDVLSGVGGSGVANYVARWADEDTLTSGVLYDNGTNAGVGTASPLGKFDVLRSSSATPGLIARSNKDGAKMNFAYTDTNSMGEIGTTYYNSTGAMRLWIGGNLNSNSTGHVGPTQQGASSSSWFSEYNTNNDYYQINRIAAGGATSSSTLFYITSAGNVGIGGVTPTLGKLQVAGRGYFGPVGTGDATTKALMDTYSVLKLKPHDSNSTNMTFAQVNNGAGIGIQVTNGTQTADWDIALNPYGGNVGIGTPSPDAKLEIKSDGSAAGGAEIRLTHANNNSTDVVSTVNFANNVGSVAMIQGGTTGANNTGYISFFTDNTGTSSEKVRIIGDGNVGIGAVSPSAKLHVKEAVSGLSSFDGNADTLILESNANGGMTIVTAAANTGRIIFASPNDATGAEIKYSDATDLMTIGTTNPNADLALQAGNGVEAVRILDDGNVGIGTTSPVHELNVAGPGDATIRITSTSTNISDNTRIGTLQYFSSDTTNNTVVGEIVSRNPVGDFGNVFDMAFSTYKVNSGALSEKMRITGAGNVGIGTTDPKQKLTVTGRSNFDSQNNYYGSWIDGDSSGDSWFAVGQWHNLGGRMEAGANNLNLYTHNTSHHLTLQKDGGNVGIGTTAPSQKLHVQGNLRVTGAYYDSNNEAGTSNQVLTSTGSGGTDWKSLSQIGDTVTGDGTTNKITKWENGPDSDLTDSSFLSESGTTLTNTATATEFTTTNTQLRLPNYGRVAIGAASTNSVLLADVGDNATFNNGEAVIKGENSGNRGTVGHSSGSDLLRLNFSDALGMILNKDGHVGIGTDPKAKLEVDLNQTNGTLAADNYVHFGGQHNTNGSVMGITLGYREANLLYRKVGIVARGIGDIHARQDLDFLVSTATGSASVTPSDAKLTISGLSGNAAFGAAAEGNTRLKIIPRTVEIASNSTNYQKAVYASGLNFYDINSGVTDSGYRIAVDASAFVLDADFEGTLANQYAIWARHGANVSAAGSTITRSIGVYIDSLTNANTTITNLYGLYQEDSVAKNYFSGSVGIGTTSSGSKLHVNGGSKYFGGGDWTTIERVTTTEGNYALYVQTTGTNTNQAIAKFNYGATAGTANSGTSVAAIAREKSYFLSNVGIGTISPTGGKLQVAGKVRIDAGSGNDALNLNAYDLLKWDSSSHIHFGGYKSGQWTVLKFYSSSTERLNISSDVNIQGATDLQINGPSRRLNFTSGTGTVRTTTSNNLILQTNSISAITIYPTQQVQFNAYGSGAFTGTATQRLAVDSSGNVIEIPIGSGPVDGSGAANKVTYWTDTDTISYNNNFHWDNTNGNLGVGTATPAATVQIVDSTSGASVLKVDGTNGTLFEVVDDLSGSLMSVNDAAGLPVFEVFADSHIVAGRYNQNDFYLDTNGNLGLGTSAPSSVLDIYEQSGKDNKLRFHNDTTGSGTSNGSGIGLNGAELFINNIENSAIKIYTQSTQTNGITILGDGKVGIGNTNPDKLFVVQGADAEIAINDTNGTPQVRFRENGVTSALIEADTDLLFKVTDEKMRITSGGNVGIGTTSPSTDFSVKEHLLFNDTTRLLTISNNTNTGGINLDGGNSRLYFSGYRALEGNSSGTTLTVGEGYGTTRISSVLNVVDHETILSPDQGSSGGIASRALTIENINDTSWTADALTAYNATTSYDITDRASYSFFPRPTQGNILTFAAQTSNNSTLHRFVNLNSSATEPLYRWDFFQYDGSGTGTGDFKVPDKLFQIRVREGVSNVEKFTIKGNGNVGIGTASPSTLLTMHQSSDTSTGGLRIENSDNSSAFRVWKQPSGGASVLVDHGVDTLFLKNGDVGIGTDSPNYKLEIDGTTDFGGTTTYNNGAAGLISWNAGTKFKVRGQSGHALSLGANGTEDYVWIATDGNVGIGTTSPGGKLHVYGGTTAFTNLSDNTDSVQITRNTSVHSHPDAKLFIYDNSNSDWAQRISLDGYSYGLRIDGWVDYGLYLNHNTLGTILVARSSELVINENGNDYNFRVEGDTDVNLLKCDAGTDSVGIGGSPNSSYKLDVSGDTLIQESESGDLKLVVNNISTSTLATSNVSLINNTGSSSGLILPSTNYTGVTGWANRLILNTDSNISNGILVRPSTGGFTVSANGLANTNLRVDTNGRVGVGTASPSYDLDVIGDISSNGQAIASYRRLRSYDTFTTSTNNTAGWYPLFNWGTTTGDRGGYRFYISYTGGSWNPNTTVLKVFKNWSGDATVTIEKYGGQLYLPEVRVIGDASTATVYTLEVYLNALSQGHSFSVYYEALGYDEGGVSNVNWANSSLALSTNTGSVIASAKVSSEGIATSNLNISNDIYLGDQIIHMDDSNTFFQFPANDEIKLQANSINRLHIKSIETVINEDGGNHDFRVEGDTDVNLLFADASTDRVGIGLATPNAKLTVSNSSGDVFNILGQSASSVFKVGATGVTQIIGATSNTVLNVLNSGSGDYMNIGSGALFVEKAGNVGIGTTGPSEKLDVVGNVKHQGLTMTSGTDVDQLKTFTQTLTITTSWQDTGIDGSDLTTGTYIVQLIGDDDEVGGAYSVYYSGMMSWFSSGTNDVDFTSEIALHRAGHADSERTLYLRTVTNLSGGNNLELQIAGNYNATGSDSYVFKFRRMI